MAKSNKPRVAASTKRQLWFLGLAWLVIAIDQLSKQWALANLTPYVRLPVIGDILGFFLVFNDSAAFSLGFGVTWIFTILSSAAVLVLLWLSRKSQTTSWAVLGGLLLGGVSGNLIDRLTQPPAFGSGHVIDFLQIPMNFPIFNVADIAISTVATISIIRILLGHKIGGGRVQSNG